MTAVAQPSPPTASPRPTPTPEATATEADAPGDAVFTDAGARDDAATDTARGTNAASAPTSSLAPRAKTTPAAGCDEPVRQADADTAARVIDRVRGSALFAKLWRCGTVSAFTTVVSNAVLVVLAGPVGLGAGWAAVVANAVGTGPSYALNRRWVWRHDGSDLWRQVVPFWVLSFAGLGLSALTVSLTAAWADGAGLTGPARSITLVAANVAAFASLWVAQFLLLDRVLFRHRRGLPAPDRTARPRRRPRV